ncbi:MAG: porin family protein [Pseudomonadota bacterium]|nr:porin family protein [Pseudomonadota bacterium]
MKNTLFAFVTVMLASTAAHADFQSFMQQPEQPYVGIDYQYSEIDTSPSVKLGSILVRAGTDLAKYIGVEAQASYGVTDDKFTVTFSDGSTARYEVKNRGSYGLYLRPNLPLNDQFTVYALLGANYADIQVKGPGISENSYGTSFAAGVGATVMFNQNFGLGAEFMQYDSDIYAGNVGVRYKF